MDISILDELTEEQLEEFLNKKRAENQMKAELAKTSYEQLRHDTIEKHCYKAIELQKLIIEFKKEAFGDLDTVYDLLQDHSKRHKDGKGNFTLENENHKIIYHRDRLMKFDERADQAKMHIFDFINSQWQGDDTTKEFIMNILNGKDGKLDIRDVQKLYKMENAFDNENWRTGLKLFKESYNETSTKDYVRFFQRQSDNSFKPIILNFATLEI